MLAAATLSVHVFKKRMRDSPAFRFSSLSAYHNHVQCYLQKVSLSKGRNENSRFSSYFLPIPFHICFDLLVMNKSWKKTWISYIENSKVLYICLLFSILHFLADGLLVLFFTFREVISIIYIRKISSKILQYLIHPQFLRTPHWDLIAVKYPKTIFFFWPTLATTKGQILFGYNIWDIGCLIMKMW